MLGRRGPVHNLDRDHRHFLPPALAALGLLPDLLPAPLRRAQAVHDEPRAGSASSTCARTSSQGPSFLSARGYAILHRMHHAFSDTPKDPHSPRTTRTSMTMMLATKKTYDGFAYRRVEPEARFDGGMPDWPALDRLSQSWVARIAWGALYTLFYVKFATHAWMFALLPLHFVMGPIHGAIVNWCGHRYGYRNFDSDDVSRNTLVVRLRHRGRALPEQPPQVRDEPELRRALVRARPDLPGHPRPRVPPHHRHDRRPNPALERSRRARSRRVVRARRSSPSR